jgi:prepilin-type N-terminal cleavage/methylation domain-containing protein
MKGFSLVEMLVVLGILGVLMSIGTYSFFAMRDTRLVEKAHTEVTGMLEEAKTLTLAALNDTSYRVVIIPATNTVQIQVAPGWTVYREILLDQRVGVTPATQATITFERVTGSVSEGERSFSIVSRSRPSITKLVRVTAGGVITSN